MFNTLTELSSKNYSVAIYIRLSKEDIDKHVESESVRNQRSLLETYVNEQGYKIYDTYIDDGFTGTNFDRPDFQRMIKDIESKKVNMVITKDLSRLGRDYIETGEYVEKYFPMKKVRYVSILDGIDTAMDNSNNDIAPFKAVINDMYSRDNSKKIRTALHTMQLKGKWVGGCPPLGFMVDPDDKNHLVINENESYIIKKIFDLACDGKSIYQIKEILTFEKIPTASILRRKHSNTQMANQGIWSSKTIRGILGNELYVGDMVQNRRQRISYKVRKIVPNDKERWIIVKDTHEAIITREQFNIVQKVLANSTIRPEKKIFRLLDGLLYCYECKGRISICKPTKTGNTYIVCNRYRMYSKLKLCTGHGFNYDKIEKAVLSELTSLFQNLLKYDDLFDKTKVLYDQAPELSKNKSELEKVLNDIESKTSMLDKTYIDKLENKITEDMFDRVCQKINKEIEILKEKEKSLKASLENVFDDEDTDKVCDRIVREFLSMEYPTKSIMIKLIKRIEIHQDKTIDIYFNFTKLNFFKDKNHH